MPQRCPRTLEKQPWFCLPPSNLLIRYFCLHPAPSGHMGIADSRGVIYDFAGPYTIGEDHMAFGRPTRYLQLDPGRCKGEQWDEAVARASETYRWGGWAPGHEQGVFALTRN